MLNDIKNISKHSFVYALGNLSVKIVGLILIPLYTNPKYLSEADYGTLAILEASIQLLVGILSLAMSQSLIRWYWDKDHEKDQKSIFFTAFIFLLSVLVLANLVIQPFTKQISGLIFDSSSYEYAFKLVIFTASFQVLNNLTLTMARARYKSLLYSTSVLFKLITVLSLTLYFLLVKGKAVDGIMEAALIGEVVLFLFLLVFTIRNSEFRLSISAIKEMISYGFPLMLASVSGVLLSVADRYMLNFITGLEETGMYTLGFKVASILKFLITTSLMLTLAPLRIQKIGTPNALRFYSKTLTYSVFIFSICLLGISLFSLEMIKLVTGSVHYWAAANLVPILSFAFLFGLMKDNVIIGLSIKKRTKIVGLLIFIVSILNIVLNAILIPLFDAYGSAVATTISQFILFILILNYAQKHYPIPYEITKLMKLIALLIVFVFAGNIISEWSLWLRLSIKTILFISFPIILYFLRFYERIELQTMKEIFQSWKSPGQFRDNLKRLLNR